VFNFISLAGSKVKFDKESFEVKDFDWEDPLTPTANPGQVEELSNSEKVTLVILVPGNEVFLAFPFTSTP